MSAAKHYVTHIVGINTVRIIALKVKEFKINFRTEVFITEH